MRLSLEQGRVIASLIEKQLTTPQQYPLSLNALVAACNQSSNREPVVRYDDGTVQRALASLKDIGLVRFIYPSRGASATRYRQVLDEYFGIGQEALGLIAVLLLRGPQTAAELRSRTERMARLGGISVDAELERMANRAEPLVRRLARGPGQKEERWVQLLTPAAPTDSRDSRAGGTGADRPPALESGRADLEGAGDDELPEPKASALRALADEVNGLRAEVAALRAVVEQLQTEGASRRAAVEQIRTRLFP